MYDIHARAEALRAEGLQGIELPFGRLIIAGRNPRNYLTYPIDCGRKTLTTTIYYLFEVLAADRIHLGIMDPSNLRLVDNRYLEIGGDLEISEGLAEDIWLILRSIYEDHVFQHPDFHQVCADLIRRMINGKLNDSVTGHC